MKAAVGDRLVVESPHTDEPRRIGVITALRHADGSPPYTVRWLDEEHEVLIFPGPDAHIEHPDRRAGRDQARHTPQQPQPDVPDLEAKEWTVHIYITEQGDDTSARAVLSTRGKTHLEGVGHARRSPEDLPVPEIGDELASARRTRDLPPPPAP